MNRIIIVVFCLLGTGAGLFGQEIGLHFMRDLWQSNTTNPALLPSTKYNIGIASIYNDFFIENIAYADAVVTDANGKKVLDVDAVISKLDDENNVIREQLNIETINLGMSFGRMTFSLGHAIRLNALMDYPKALPQLVWEGNAQFIGQEVQFAPDVSLMAYNEFAAGVALELSPMVTIGGRVKYLTGLADGSSSGNDLRLLTSDDAYQLTLLGDYRINSSGALDYDGYDQITFDLESDDFQEFFTRNSGWAFDLGLHARLGRFDLAASVLDLGKINWDENVTNYTIVTPAEFSGIDVAQQILDDSETVGSVLDSLTEQYEVIETNEAYSTKLPRKIYLSVGYQFTDIWRFGALYYNERYREQTYSAYALSANAQLLSWLNVGGTYAIRTGTFDNLGLNTAMKFGPVQLFAMTDNVLAAFNAAEANKANFRFGLNLAFGRRDGNTRKNDIDDISDQERFFN